MTTASSMSTWEMYRSLLFSVYLPSLLMSICQGSVVLILPLYALDLGGGPGIAAAVLALRGLGNMASDVPAGYAAARLGDKVTMLIGIGIMAATGLAASQITTSTALAIAALFFGGGMSTWLLARLTHISEDVPSHQRGRAIALMAGIQRFGNLIGPIASGFIAVKLGFGVVFAIVALIAAMSFILVLFTIKANRRTHHDESPDLIRLIPHVIGQHRRIFATTGVAVLLLTVVRAGRQLLVPLWGESIGLDAADIGLIVGIASGVDMTLFPLAGYIMDTLGRRHSANACLLLQSIGLAAMPLAGSFIGLLAVAVACGIGNGLGSGINMTLGADLAPPDQRGEFLGVWRLIGDSGWFAGPALIGYVAATFMLTPAVFATAGLGFVGAAMVMTFVRETLQSNRS